MMANEREIVGKRSVNKNLDKMPGPDQVLEMRLLKPRMIKMTPITAIVWKVRGELTGLGEAGTGVAGILETGGGVRFDACSGLGFSVC
mgnify:CR=1 FL=1